MDTASSGVVRDAPKVDRECMFKRLKQEFLGNRATARPEPQRTDLANVPEEFANPEKFPEYIDIKNMGEYYRKNNMPNFYFCSRSDVANDTVTVDGRSLINFSGYNYLGLSGDPRVIDFVSDSIRTYGTSVSASRIAGGEIDLHAALERELAEMVGTEDCVVSVGGYITNAAVIGYLCRRKDLIIHDELIHNSLMAGCTLSGARRIPFPHNRLDALERILEENRGRYERVLIIVEGAYSMDGDIPDIARIVEIKKRYKALLMVDEAHSLGVVGARGHGVTEYCGVSGSDIDILMGTLSKSFASCGGFIAGSHALITMIKYFAPGLVLYSAGITPGNTAAALAALRLMRAEPDRVQRLQDNARHFLQGARAAGFDVGDSKDTAVVPVILRDSDLALWLMARLMDDGICVHAMLHPVVPRELVRLRFFITASHSREQLDHTVSRLAYHMKRAPAAAHA